MKSQRIQMEQEKGITSKKYKNHSFKGQKDFLNCFIRDHIFMMDLNIYQIEILYKRLEKDQLSSREVLKHF